MNIKACPFCEKEDVELRDQGEWYWVECMDCGGRGTKCLNDEVAIIHWNFPTERIALFKKMAEEG